MQQIKILLLKDAQDFLLSIPEKARQKFNDAIHRIVTGGKDVRIFKKLKKSDFSEFRIFHFPQSV